MLCAYPLHAVDLTTELILSGFSAQTSDNSSAAWGTFFVLPYKSNKAQVDLHFQIGENRNKFNVAQVKLYEGSFDFTLGRQLMAWGSGYNFNPTDIFNSKPLGAAFDPSYYKTGRDALAINSYFGDFIVDVTYAIPYKNETSIENADDVIEDGSEDIGIRIKKNIGDYDVALSAVNVSKRTYSQSAVEFLEPSDSVLGLSIKGSIPKLDWGVWVESAQSTRKTYR